MLLLLEAPDLVPGSELKSDPPSTINLFNDIPLFRVNVKFFLSQLIDMETDRTDTPQTVLRFKIIFIRRAIIFIRRAIIEYTSYSITRV